MPPGVVLDKLKLLFLCTGNSCRSQMAEGWARHLKGDRLEVHSAGVEPHGVDPRTVQVMAEAGVDISEQRSENVTDVAANTRFDWVVTVCDDARERCPVFAGRARMAHVSFQDPARAVGSDAEVLAVFRRVRDEIRAFVDTLPESLVE